MCIRDSSEGRVRVFELVNGRWEQVGGSLDGQPRDSFGSNVAITSDGSRIAVRAGGVTVDNIEFAGRLQVFDLVNGQWVQVGQNFDGEASEASPGSAVDFSTDGSRILVSSPGHDAFGRKSGRVQIFDLENGRWVQVGGDVNGRVELDLFGDRAVMSADGSRFVASGCLLYTSPSPRDRG